MNDSGGWLRDWATWLVNVVTLVVVIAMVVFGVARIGS